MGLWHDRHYSKNGDEVLILSSTCLQMRKLRHEKIKEIAQGHTEMMEKSGLGAQWSGIHISPSHQSSSKLTSMVIKKQSHTAYKDTPKTRPHTKLEK